MNNPQHDQEDLLKNIMDKAMPSPTSSDPGIPADSVSVPPDQAEGKRPRKGSSVFLYLSVLFACAFVMLLLAYFIQQRNSEAHINTSIQSYNDLLRDNQSLQDQLAGMEEAYTELTQEKTDADVELVSVRHHLEDARQLGQLLTTYSLLEHALREENYEQAAVQFRTLALLYEQDPDSFSLEQTEAGFDLPLRLYEISLLLTELGQADIPAVFPEPSPND